MPLSLRPSPLTVRGFLGVCSLSLLMTSSVTATVAPTPSEPAGAPHSQADHYAALGLATPELRARFEAVVATRKGPVFDPALKLLFVANPTHATYANLTPGVPVHVTRDTLYLACGILKNDDTELYPAARALLVNLLPMQDANPASPTYGTWPRAYELPLATDPKPDLNWTAFFGEALLDLRLSHPERLADDLRDAVDRAIIVAARATLARTGRHADPGYTNIAVKGATLACLAGQLSDDPELKARALEKLRGIVAFTRHHGDFTEYNSPTYTWVAVNALQTLRQYTTDAETRAFAEELYHLAWEGIGLHYHAPSGQWTGPCSRAYFDLLGPNNDFANTLPEALAAPPAAFSVPEDLRHLFLPASLPRTVVRSYFLANDPPSATTVNGELLGILPLVATTYLTPGFAVGSISIGDFWWQKRAVLAHWGDRENPGCFRLRFLTDGQDFQAPVIASVQATGRVLSAISFPSDGALHHYDRLPGGKLTTSSLRLRFEFGGSGRDATLSAPASPGAPVQIELGSARLTLQLPAVIWGNATRYEIGRDNRTAWLDLVLSDGKPAEIDFNRLKSALIVIALEFSAASPSPASLPPAPVITQQDDDTEITWTGLAVRAPHTPATKEKLLHRYRLGASLGVPAVTPE
jgi:hypothetical protein